MKKQGRKARGSRTKFLNNNWTPVETCVRTFQFGKSNNIVIDRNQFPLICAEAITVHKSQGGTYAAVAVHTDGMQRSHLYVAFSRATSIKGLFIVGKFKPRLK